MDFSATHLIEVGSGAKIATPSNNNYNPGYSIQVPATSNIGVFYSNGSRVLKTTSKVYLSTVSYLYFYIIKDFYGATDYDTYLQYSYDGSNWTTFNDGSLIHDAQDMPNNTWTLRTIEIEAAAKYYAGVYLRFYQTSFGSSFGDDVWAFSSVVASTGSPVSGSQVGSENLNIAIMDFNVIDNFNLGDGARIINPGVSYGPASSSVIPSYASIGSLDGVRVDRYGSRIISTKNRVYLSTIDYLYYYVIKDFYETTDYDAYFQYSLDNSTWTTIDTLDHDGDATIVSNVWSQRRVLVPSGAKNYGGVYLRFYQGTFNSNVGYDGWAFSSVMAAFSAASSSGSVYDGNVQLSVMNFNNPDTLEVGDPARITTPSGVSGNPASSSVVPSYTNIGVLDSNINASPPSVSRTGTREIATRNRVILIGYSALKYRVRKDWYNTTSYDAYFQYSLDNSTWTTIDTLDHDGDATIVSNVWSQRRVLVPSGAKNYGGVYLRFYQGTFNSNAGYDGWAFTSVIGVSNPSLSDDTSTNSTYYPTISTSSSSADFRTSSSKLTYNPSTGTLTSTIVADAGGNLRKLPNLSRTSAYTLVIGDVGYLVNITTGGVTVPSGVFSAGDAISIYNNSASSQIITQGGSVTMYLAGTSITGNRTLIQRGVCTVLCVASNTFVISGAGLS